MRSPFNSVAGRVAVAIIGAITLGIALMLVTGAVTGKTVIVSGQAVMSIDPARNNQMLSAKIATIAQLMDAAPSGQWPSLIHQINRLGIQASVLARPVAESTTIDRDRRTLLRRLIAVQSGFKGEDIIVDYRPQPAAHVAPAGTDLLVELRMRSGNWLLLDMPNSGPDKDWLLRLVEGLAQLLVLIGILSMITAWWVAAPINHFAAAAERMGMDVAAPPMPADGPFELKMAVNAFNRMQERLKRYLSDRTQMLAAMSHDLRAPLARLRLRAEFMEDRLQQRKMLADLDAMNAMIDATLAFVRDDVQHEPARLVDLDNLIEDMCEDIRDAGQNVTYSGLRGVNIVCRPGVLRRAIANLVENAAKYGGAARVKLIREAGRVVILVEDDGPGIPNDEHEKVFAPFYRLEPARDPQKGGVGLGLSVARSIARGHGGDVVLANRAERGLTAKIELPG